EGYHAHPLNRGWMNAFRRWTRSEVFRKYWLLLRGEYSWDFVRFCESELNLDPGKPRLVRTRCGPELLQRPEWLALSGEFAAEWPTVPGGLNALADATEDLAGAFSADAGPAPPPLWLINLTPAGQELAGAQPAPDYPCGVILVWQPPDSASDFELVVWIRGA